jgi:hypothetical protein
MQPLPTTSRRLPLVVFGCLQNIFAGGLIYGETRIQIEKKSSFHQFLLFVLVFVVEKEQHICFSIREAWNN